MENKLKNYSYILVYYPGISVSHIMYSTYELWKMSALNTNSSLSGDNTFKTLQFEVEQIMYL